MRTGQAGAPVRCKEAHLSGVKRPSQEPRPSAPPGPCPPLPSEYACCRARLSPPRLPRSTPAAVAAEFAGPPWPAAAAAAGPEAPRRPARARPGPPPGRPGPARGPTRLGGAEGRASTSALPVSVPGGPRGRESSSGRGSAYSPARAAAGGAWSTRALPRLPGSPAGPEVTRGRTLAPCKHKGRHSPRGMQACLAPHSPRGYAGRAGLRPRRIRPMIACTAAVVGSGPAAGRRHWSVGGCLGGGVGRGPGACGGGPCSTCKGVTARAGKRLHGPHTGRGAAACRSESSESPASRRRESDAAACREGFKASSESSEFSESPKSAARTSRRLPPLAHPHGSTLPPRRRPASSRLPSRARRCRPGPAAAEEQGLGEGEEELVDACGRSRVP